MGRGRGWIVLKFGGTSVASAAGWAAIEGAVRCALAEDRRAMVVCSAVSGVSDALDHAIGSAAAGAPTGGVVARLTAIHHALCEALGVAPVAIGSELEGVRARLATVRLARAADPRTRAAIMAAGERMSTAIGAAWLASRGVDAEEWDARELLVGRPDPDERHRYLSATVAPTRDLDRVAQDGPGVVVTQGFLASDGEGGTVLLGRGGSDTSAARIATLLDAARVEIWTDVDGMYSADPGRQRSAGFLPRLSYDEAEAMATLGAKVLHPRCLAPVRDAGIPLRVRCTFRPESEGTLVDGSTPPAGVRAVTSRRGLALVRVSRPSRWQPVGFLAEAAACFARRGLSIDLVCTSPSVVGATIDPAAAPGVPLEPLLSDLAELGQVDLVRPVASVSLVGTALRATPTSLGAALATAAGISVHLLVHGASDHHLTFIVDEADEVELVARLHASLFGRAPSFVGIGSEPAAARVAS